MTPEVKAAFVAYWVQKSPEKQLEEAFAMRCTIQQLQNQLAGARNQLNTESWRDWGKEQDKANALAKGRTIGERQVSLNAEENKRPIIDCVRALFENSKSPLDKHGTLINQLTGPQIANVVREKTGSKGYTDSTFQKIVNKEVALQKRLQKERLGKARPDLS